MEGRYAAEVSAAEPAALRRSGGDAPTAVKSSTSNAMQSKFHTPYPIPHTPYPIPHTPYPIPHTPYPIPINKKIDSMSKPVCLLWLDDSQAYEQALADAGIADRFELHFVKREETPPEDLIPRVEVLAGWTHGKLLGRMPKLRWIQAMTAGVETWLDAPGLRDDVALVLCAWLAPSFDVREHPRCLVSSDQAVHGSRTRPETKPLDTAPVAAAGGADLGHSWPRCNRAGAGAEGMRRWACA